ncbi:hypothetical protein KV557_24750 [Kitasatospora aureofaciens]|uniref:hypothetical protein n=1 Tax=Kitasatospora aureofaciens TaxID=1894 RepID=UPI001C488154|nr:hypothetical protein [Kitasatospora aureofaciens]MBV6700275.1 hypothetical protein [Kitasatospora aureofaciens]
MTLIINNLLDQILGPETTTDPVPPALLAALVYGVTMQDHSTNGGYGHEPQPQPHQGEPGNDGKRV